MNLRSTAIYPIKVWFGNVLDDEEVTRNDLITLQDVIENLSPDTHHRLQSPQSAPAMTDTGMFTHNVRAMEKVKDLFHDACISLHEDKYPQFKGNLKIYDSIARGAVINHNTTVQETMSNHPWSYTGILVCRTPEGLPPGQGDIVFIDPLPASDYNDQHGVSSQQLGNIAIFPGWLKYRLRPISLEQGTYDTVMFLIMSAMVVHTQNEEALMKEIASLQKQQPAPRPPVEDMDDLMQLGPVSDNPGEIDIGVYTSDDKKDRTDD